MGIMSVNMLDYEDETRRLKVIKLLHFFSSRGRERNISHLNQVYLQLWIDTGDERCLHVSHYFPLNQLLTSSYIN